MKVWIEFGLFNPAYNGVEYSSDLELANFELEQIPPIGTRFRFDCPTTDDDGRYLLDFDHDGSDPIYTILREVEMGTNNEVTGISWTSLRLEVEQENPTEKTLEDAKGYIRSLQRFHAYLTSLEKAEQLAVGHEENGFDSEASKSLQNLGCFNLKQVAMLCVGVFEGRENLMKKVEMVLKNHGLMLLCGPMWTSYRSMLKT